MSAPGQDALRLDGELGVGSATPGVRAATRTALDDAPYLKALVELRERDPLRMMVPGHKGGAAIPAAVREAFGAGAEAVFALDLPAHMTGIDIGPPDPSPAQQALELAAQAWGAHQTWFVLGGASQANQMACLALSMLAPWGRRPRVAVARNVHQSVIYGLILADADVVWLEPEVDATYGIQHGVSPDALRAALDGSGFDAVFVVSPTYFGAVSDVAGLSAVVAQQRTPDNQTLLIVDEAWGSHFPFAAQFPDTAAVLGADLVISSIHKISGSLTQSAMLHLATPDDKLRATVADAVRHAEHLVKSTSPSSLLFASLDAARAYVAGEEGSRLLVVAAEQARRVRERAAQLPGVTVIDERIADCESVATFDPLKVTLDVSGTGLTGLQVRDRLVALGEGVEIEFCTEELIVALFGLGDGAVDLSDRFIDALEAVLAGARVGNGADGEGGPEDPLSARRLLGLLASSPRPATRVTLCEAYFGQFQDIELEVSAGRVCVELVAPYPPGIALVMPGEEITPQIRDYLMAIRAAAGEARGLEFADCDDPTLRWIRVLAEGSTAIAPPPRGPAFAHRPPQS